MIARPEPTISSPVKIANGGGLPGRTRRTTQITVIVVDAPIAANATGHWPLCGAGMSDADEEAGEADAGEHGVRQLARQRHGTCALVAAKGERGNRHER